MKNKLLKLDEILRESDAPILEFLNPGLEKEAIVNWLKENNFNLNDEFIELYQWHNGIDLYLDGSDSLFELLPFGKPFTLDEIIIKRDLLIDWEIIDNAHTFIPFAGSGEGEMYLLKNDSSGEVYDFNPFSNVYGDLIFSSIGGMFDCIIECLEKSIFVMDAVNGLQLDFDKNDEIKAKYLNKA
jgi:hypothetical protein